jgi:hypothetical protein
MTLLGSLKSLGLRLWDESTRKLVGYRHLREAKKAAKAQSQSSAPDVDRERERRERS